jgi:hypothetical protein
VEFEPHPYGHAVHSVAAEILGNRNVVLQMTFGSDDICKPCKHNIDGVCDDEIDISHRPLAPSLKREWNLLLDERWCERLNIQEGRRLTAFDFCKLLQHDMGNITDIYREISVYRTAERAEKLQNGIVKFLQ